ncbi:uncharacterized protein LOC110433094 [Sorghum bicolor]|uniref:uncharacterized protein LOC110433094 n=1 Tax=Sorghum bicolor TaxID=4558 RepID=UPI000B425351|nr:uncharacterized protein LOC110433094 [Sorghum bicolor]|eukprot:XP_021310406.1 uncharacterized protein LOC110433094 [Sorghum bicolor]
MASYLLSIGFVEAKSDTSLFVYQCGSDTAYLLLYVDDIVLTASSTDLLRRIISALQREFAMKDLGELHHFLGMHVQRSGDGLLLSQRQYMLDILDRARMAECKPCSTPVDTNPKVAAAEEAPVSDVTDFRSLVGALQYLTFTRPDIAYAVQQVCLHMHDPREPHLAALKRILRYVRGTLHLGLMLRPSTSTDLVVYTDADWAGCPDTRKSTSGYMPCSLATILSPGPPSARTRYQDPVLKPSIARWPMELQRLPGCASSFSSCMPLFGAPHWCIVTTLVLST